MRTRDRVEDIGKNLNANGSFVDDGKTLLHDYISVEELRACTQPAMRVWKHVCWNKSVGYNFFSFVVINYGRK
jgi:hypothetical protein